MFLLDVNEDANSLGCYWQLLTATGRIILRLRKIKLQSREMKGSWIFDGIFK